MKKIIQVCILVIMVTSLEARANSNVVNAVVTDMYITDIKNKQKNKIKKWEEQNEKSKGDAKLEEESKLKNDKKLSAREKSIKKQNEKYKKS